jgi:SAM-dependent methyltransferase
MATFTTAERVSTEASDNFVLQRSMLAYRHVASMVSGDVLEIGTGTGYGIATVAPHCNHFTSVDKYLAQGLISTEKITLRKMTVPPLDFPDATFDYVFSFQVIEHIDDDKCFVREVARVLKPGGRFIVTTPHAPMSLTRNPWHVREYRIDELNALLAPSFASVEQYGVEGNEAVAAYYEKNKQSVARLARLDILDLQHRLPRRLLQLPYDVLNRINRRRLLRQNRSLTMSLTMDDYRICPVHSTCYDLFYVATK